MSATPLECRIADAQAVILDLDNTLYPRQRGVFNRINERIDDYVMGVIGTGREDARRTRRQYIETYGTTLGGLMALYGVEPDRYLEYVHDVPVEEMLEPDPKLAVFLDGIGLPRLVLTNASADHAARVLLALGVRGAFDGIVDLKATGYLGKPHPLAYGAAMDFAGAVPGRSIFVDDVQVNVGAARRMGLISVLVGNGDGAEADLEVERVHDLGAHFSHAPWWTGD